MLPLADFKIHSFIYLFIYYYYHHLLIYALVLDAGIVSTSKTRNAFIKSRRHENVSTHGKPEGSIWDEPEDPLGFNTGLTDLANSSRGVPVNLTCN